MDAPRFTLPDQDRNPVSSADFSGRRLVVFFYPKAMTYGCTMEVCDFRDYHQELLDAGVAVVGVSPDSPETLTRFREKERLPFPLLSDQDHAVAEAFGVWGAKNLFRENAGGRIRAAGTMVMFWILRLLYGKETVGLIRSTFVVGPAGELEQEYRNVPARGHVGRLKRDLLGA